jgi:uncharacterized protein YkwD
MNEHIAISRDHAVVRSSSTSLPARSRLSEFVGAFRRAASLAVFSALFVACAARSPSNTLMWPAAYPTAREYATTGEGPAAFLGDAPSVAVRGLIERAADARGLAVRGDGRLATLAKFLAHRRDPTQPPPPRLLEFGARQLGLFDPSIEAYILTAASDRSDELVEALKSRLGSQPFTHYGALVVTRAGEDQLTVVFSERRLTLASVPRSVAVGQPIRLEGQLPAEYTNPRVDLLAQGKRVILPLGDGHDFSAQLPTTAAGLYRVEIVADARLGSVVLAKLPVYVGSAAASGIELPSFERAYDTAAIAARIFESINRTRADAGLPRLTRDARLDVLAAQHCADMRDHGFVGHMSPRSGDPQKRVTRAGMSAELVLETIARGPDPHALETNLGAPSGEIRNLLSRAVTHVGIGVVSLPDAHAATLVATELFVALPAPVDPGTATPQLLSLVNEARARRGERTLLLDAGLSGVARETAERFVDDPNASEQSVLAAADAELGKFSLSYRRVNALITLTSRLDDAAALEPVLDAAASGLGIGIAHGSRGSGTTAIVMVVGAPR